MIQVRKAADRGHAHHGWLKTHHTFSFATYQDPQHVRFRSLRVMNEDVISPGKGFGKHPHHDMEIITYILDGALEHRDSLGNGEVIAAGELQRMTAGTGIIHSETNFSHSSPVHLYQIWLYPNRTGLPPGYEQKTFPDSDRLNRLCLVASPDSAEGSLLIHQDAKIYLATVEAGSRVGLTMQPGRHAWLQVLRGAVALNDVALDTADGAAVSEEISLEIVASTAAEVMLFDLA
jgi:redox-sensitive bicupin YhaK (pirin superfamily)